MRWTKAVPAFSLPGLLLISLIIATASGQDACDGPAQVSIGFPELDPPNNPSPLDSRYAQLILTSGIEPHEVNILDDPDRSNGYSFDQYFAASFNPANNPPGYYVYMTKGIDRDGSLDLVEDDTNILQYSVQCRSTLGAPIRYSILKIQIRDVNDNPPMFRNAPYAVTVNELTPKGLTIFRGISASDLDEGLNKQVSYQLSDSPGAQFSGTQYFYIPSASEGLVSVRNDLDFESMYRATNNDLARVIFNITVTAFDDGVPQRSAKTTLIISITDGDDQGPECVYPSCIPSTETFGKSCIRPKYRASIPSGSTSNTNLVFSPEPSDVNNPTIDIIMQDRDTLNSSVTCIVAATAPAGYENYFQASASFITGSVKQHRCQVTYTVPAGQPAIFRDCVPELEIILEAVEETSQRRVDSATIVLEVLTACVGTS